MSVMVRVAPGVGGTGIHRDVSELAVRDVSRQRLHACPTATALDGAVVGLPDGGSEPQTCDAEADFLFDSAAAARRRSGSTRDGNSTMPASARTSSKR
jgi:hypothetical protein